MDAFVTLAILVFASLLSTRYLIGGSAESKIRPIFYVVGILLAPITIAAAIIKWLFMGRA